MLIEDFVGLDHLEATSRGRFDELKKFRQKWRISRPRNSWIRLDGVLLQRKDEIQIGKIKISEQLEIF